MKFEKFEYLWPPRPTNPIHKGLLGFYQNLGYSAQYKKNGTCNLIAVSPDKRIIYMNRHKDYHRAWKPNEATDRAFMKLPGKCWYVFVAELLHSKTPNIKNTNYLHDILVYENKQLVNLTFVQRQELLRSLFKIEDEDYSHYMVNSNTWVAKNFDKFESLFGKIDKEGDEGLVLKLRTSKLKPCFKADSNSTWQVKCRIASNNYSF